jgi:hypothetical protein
MFYAQTDARYYQGKETAHGRLPYAERYTYEDFDRWSPDPAPDTAYIFHQTQRILFPDSRYTVEEYGGHGVAIAG